MSEAWKEYQKARAVKRRHNLEHSTDVLKALKVEFTSHNLLDRLREIDFL